MKYLMISGEKVLAGRYQHGDIPCQAPRQRFSSKMAASLLWKNLQGPILGEKKCLTPLRSGRVVRE